MYVLGIAILGLGGASYFSVAVDGTVCVRIQSVARLAGRRDRNQTE